MRGVMLVGILVVASAARAELIDPAKLAPIAVEAGGTGEQAQLFAGGVDADVLVRAIAPDNIVMLAGQRSIDGRLATSVPAGAVADALARGLDVIKLRRTRNAHDVDLDLVAAKPLDVLRILADGVGASYVFAPSHPLPAITIHTRHGDAHEIARAIAKLCNVQLLETKGVWVVVDPATALDPKLVARMHAKSRIDITHAHPGEARRLLEPDEPQARNACPADVWVEASLHGQTGVLEAVLAAFDGPPCEQHPKLDELDTATATLVGILIEPATRRAVFRVPHGARAFEPKGPTDEGRVEIGYVVVHHDPATLSAPEEAPDTTGPFAAHDPRIWRLAATVRVGTHWTAIFRVGTTWKLVEGGRDVEITAGTASSKQRAYSLER